MTIEDISDYNYFGYGNEGDEMSKHDHEAGCGHSPAYCPKCDVCYCKFCGREWGKTQYYPYWTTTYPNMAAPYSYGTTFTCDYPNGSPSDSITTTTATFHSH